MKREYYDYEHIMIVTKITKHTILIVKQKYCAKINLQNTEGGKS